MSELREVGKISNIRSAEEKGIKAKEEWFENYGWILEEQAILREKTSAIRERIKTHAIKSHRDEKMNEMISKLSAKPVPVTSAAVIGWLVTKPDFILDTMRVKAVNIPILAPLIVQFEGVEYKVQ